MYLPLKSFLEHLIFSKKRGYGIHSPFVYGLVRALLVKQSHSEELKRWKNIIYNDMRYINPSLFGAGSRKNKNSSLRAGKLAKRTSSKHVSRFLVQLCNYYQPEYFFELGTSFGFTAFWVSMANPPLKTISIEGNKDVYNIALEGKEYLSIKNLTIKNMLFEDALKDYIQTANTKTIYFLDGHHSEGPTIQYVNMVVDSLQEEWIIVIDDIRWSRGMEKAWHKIKSLHKNRYVFIDCFFIGVMIKKPGLPGQCLKVWL